MTQKSELNNNKSTTQVNRKPDLTMSHGVLIRKGEVKPGKFIQTFSIPHTGNSYFDGSFEELSTVVQDHMHDYEPGAGSVNNDVILVNIPADRVKTTVTTIDDTNRHLVVVEEHVRQDGEKPVVRKVIQGKPENAKYAQVVLYRADTLERDNDRSTDAEWEMVAVLGKIDTVEPMHPTTMMRNSNHEEGGTYREYTDEEWTAAYEYWDNHAYLVDTIENNA